MLNIFLLVIALFIVFKTNLSLGLKFVICILLLLFISSSTEKKEEKVEIKNLKQFQFILNNRVLKNNKEKAEPIFFLLGGFDQEKEIKVDSFCTFDKLTSITITNGKSNEMGLIIDLFAKGYWGILYDIMEIYNIKYACN